MIQNLFADAQKTAAANLSSLATDLFQGAEKLAALNLQVVKTSVAEAIESTQAVLSVKTPQDFMTLQAALWQVAPQKALAYGRQVKEIIDEATAKQRSDAQTQVADVQTKFLDAVNGVLKNAPGSENTLALVKSAVAAANNAYEGVNRATKQVGDAVEANLTQLTETAVKTSRTSRAKSEV